jgi:hypothetical protein
MTEQEKANVTAKRIVTLLRINRVCNGLEIMFGAFYATLSAAVCHGVIGGIFFVLGLFLVAHGLRSAWRFPL